jgi:hypothetical protein
VRREALSKYPREMIGGKLKETGSMTKPELTHLIAVCSQCGRITTPTPISHTESVKKDAKSHTHERGPGHKTKTVRVPDLYGSSLDEFDRAGGKRRHAPKKPAKRKRIVSAATARHLRAINRMLRGGHE